MTPEGLPDPIAVALEVAGIFDRLEVLYLVAGSLASSVHGEPRSTNDVDFVADLDASQVRPLLDAFGDRYYVSADAVLDAVRVGASFNVIHLGSAVKADVFVVGEDAFDAERLAHRERVRVGLDERHELWVDTAEHTVLRKLEWYRRGDEVSERQWGDVVGILRAQGSRLDRGRLGAWASRLGVSDLLERAWGEV
jgi:hypothetical protein